MKTDIEKPIQAHVAEQMGATPHAGGVFFRVWVPHAESVFVTGSFNDWKPYATSLLPLEGGQWAVNVDEAKPGDEYNSFLKTATLSCTETTLTPVR
jgi:1,4-alpha-glucan branching enzyme